MGGTVIQAKNILYDFLAKKNFSSGIYHDTKFMKENDLFSYPFRQHRIQQNEAHTLKNLPYFTGIFNTCKQKKHCAFVFFFKCF
jgi:hypothetical protein